jgi:hypothetical protein
MILIIEITVSLSPNLLLKEYAQQNASEARVLGAY